MKATCKKLSADYCGSEKVAAENSAALEELAASQFLVDVVNDVVPAERLKEGMPFLRSNEAMTAPFTPDRNDSSS